MDAETNREEPTTFRGKLARHETWTPELRQHAIRYLIANTIQPGAMALRELAGIEEPTPFKTEIAPLLVDRLTPRELLEIWNQWESLKGNYMAVALGAAFSSSDETDPSRGLRLPSYDNLPLR
jgi:hypothetical protein